MAGKVRFPLDIPQEMIPRLEILAKADNRSVSGIIIQATREYLDSIIGASKSNPKDPVDYLLRQSEHPSSDWLRGGRWFLDYLVRSEPDFKRHHPVITPRHWPIPFAARERRCWANGGGDACLSINDHITEMRGSQLPSDFPTLTLDQWLEICRRFTGCCGEHIRFPGGPHWDAICPRNMGAAT